MARTLIKVLTYPIIVLVILGIYYLIDKEKNKINKNIVYLPKVLLYVGIFTALFFTIILLLSVLFGPKQSLSPILYIALPFPILCIPISLIIAYFNCRIYFTQEDFVYRTFFGRKYKFIYSDIKNIKRGKSGDIYIYTDKKRLFIDKMAFNADIFLKNYDNYYLKKK